MSCQLSVGDRLVVAKPGVRQSSEVMRWRKKLVLISLWAMNLVEQPAPEVHLQQGTLVGRVSSDGSFLLYTGIPYASTGSSTRFQAPGPPPQWRGIFKAVDDFDVCPQTSIISGVVVGNEDCLKLNVYVPIKRESKRPLSVMVFIHGGAFVLGSGGNFVYGPDYFMNKHVILVTFNYRLGALGFICLGIKEAPGNAGLKDQIAALKWVRSNIAEFGGNPDDVTLFGESAGATSASILMSSPAAEGLFRRAILQSGSSISNWAINRNPLWVASLTASRLGFHSEDPHELYNFLSKVELKDLVPIVHGKPEQVFFDTQLLHLPCVEKQIPGEEPVFNDLPWNTLLKKQIGIPVIHGTNSREGMFLTAAANGSVEERNGKFIFASDLQFDTEEDGMRVSLEAQKFYFGSDRISMLKIDNITDLYTHLYFEIPSIIETELLVNRSAAPVYNYLFDYSGGRNFLKFRSARGSESGACHGDELFYMFNAKVLPFRVSRDDQMVIDQLTTMWSNFAKYGEPTPAGSNLLPGGMDWTASERGSLRFLHIESGQKVQMRGAPNPGALQLWRNIYLSHRRIDLGQPALRSIRVPSLRPL
ncbi:unnamed protein product [Leptosia nina]|uniref:Carboxylic ester hydrolase n=1 Tax=Leptosia nina TaxID=320188 RepID=A0AAV1JQ96_9NEOP